MIIKTLAIKNYRNLDGLEVSFSNDINFLVGDNNTGKTNLLELIGIISKARSFEETDYFDLDNPIEIIAKLHLVNLEIGAFDYFCDPDDEHSLTVIIKQENPDENPEYIHLATGKTINKNKLLLLNGFYYNSVRNPKDELFFTKRSGAGKFLNYLISQFKEKNSITEFNFVDEEKIRDLRDDIKESVDFISAFTDNGIGINIEKSALSVLPQLFSFLDSNDIKLQDSGCGVQYVIMLYMSILENTLNICSSRSRIIESDGKKHCFAVQCFDEPEIHLNPFLQRSTIAYISSVSAGKDAEFNKLIKKVFSLDIFQAQVFVATHSASILSDNYEKIIRLYINDSGKVKAISGINIAADHQMKKQWHSHFEYIKEALFARKVLVAEGYSETGAFPIFADKLGFNFDKNCVSVINAGGVDSVLPIMKLLEAFSYKVVGIRDSDDAVRTSGSLFCTNRRDFELEIIGTLLKVGRDDLLSSIIQNYDFQFESRMIQIDALNIARNTCQSSLSGFFLSDFIAPVRLKDIFSLDEKIKIVALYWWYSTNKGIILSKSIATAITPELVPQCYIDVINALR